MGDLLYGLRCNVILGKPRTKATVLKALIDEPFNVINTGYRRFSSPPFTIEFESEFASAGKPNPANLRLYNPGPETIAAAKVEKYLNGKLKPPLPIILVEAGYGDDLGQVIVGEAYSSILKRARPDNILEIKILDVTFKWRQAWISKTWPAYSLASDIIEDVLQSVGLSGTDVNLGEDIVSEKSVSYNKSLAAVIADLCKKTESKFYFSAGRLIIEPIEEKANTKNLVLLTPQSGLLDNPEETDNGYKFRSLFNYRLGAGVTISVKSRDVEGYFKIFRGKHSLNEITATTEFEAKRVNL